MKMKKAFAVALACALLLGLAACDWFGGNTTQAQTTTQAETTTETEPTTQLKQVTLYLPNENADGFITRQAETDGSIEGVVALLVAEGALPEGCAPLGFSVEDAALDMNEAFLQAVNNTGTTGEYLRFGSLVNTVLGFFGLEVLYITAQGQVIETGHNTYDFVFRFYENHAG